MKFSIIIATYNRLPELKELFDSALKLHFDFEQFEFVIVDDGSEDGTESWIESQQFPFAIQYYKQHNQGPGAARNKGMELSNGTYFLFIDSDCMLPANYLKALDDGIEKFQPDAFGGPDTYHESFSDTLKAINYAMTSFLGTGGTRGSKKAVTRFYPRSFNMGIHRKVFETIGGMGSLRHGQDMDFSARIYAAGFKVSLIPDAAVYHKRRTNLRLYYKQIFNWGVTRINLGRIHPGMLKPIHLLPACIVAVGIVLFLISFFWTPARRLFGIGILSYLLIIAFAFIQSGLQYKSIKVGLLSMVTLTIQVLAYGYGTLSGIAQWICGEKTAKGFTKNYYK